MPSAILARGSHWREALDLPALADLTVSDGGGESSLPLLDASDPIPAATWRPEGNQVYSVLLDHEPGTAGADRLTLYWNGELMRRRNSVQDLMEEADYHAQSPVGVAASVVSIRAAVDPRTQPGGTYEYSRRQFGVNVQTGTTLSGIHARRQTHPDGAIRAGLGAQPGSPDTVVRQCLASDGHKHNVGQGPGLTEDVVAWRGEGDEGFGTAARFVVYMQDPSGRRHVFRRTHAEGGPRGGGVVGYLAHGDVGLTFSEVRYEGATANDCQGGLEAGGIVTVVCADAQTGREPFVSGTRNCGLYARDRLSVASYLVRGRRAGLAGERAFRRVNLQADHVVAEGVCVWSEGQPFESTVQIEAGAGGAVLERSAIVRAGGAGATIEWTRGSTLTVRGVVVDTLGANHHLALSNPAGYTADYNVFVDDLDAPQVNLFAFSALLAGVRVASLFALQLATGQDLNSVTARRADQADGQAGALWLGVASKESAGPPDGDFRVNPNARVFTSSGRELIGIFPDGTALVGSVGALSPRTSWPVLPETLAAAERMVTV